MSANVHVVDERRYDTQELLNREIELSRRAPGSYPNEIFTITSSWSMDRICRRVRQVSGDQVGVLRLLCHGNASYVQLGTELRRPEDVRSFELLRGCWIGRYPKIILDACGVASSTQVSCTSNSITLAQLATICTPGTVSPTAPAHRLLQALADAAGVLVVAAYDVQLGPNARGLEGRIHYYRPVRYYLHAAADLRAA